MRHLALVLPLMVFISCKDRDESLVKEFIKRPVTGMIDGESWEIKYAYIDPTAGTPKDSDFAFIFLDYKPTKPCPRLEKIPPSAKTVTVSAPNERTKKPVKLKAGSPRTMVMQWVKSDQQVAIIAKRGYFQVLSSKPDRVKGKIRARYDSDNWMNGYFTADVCAFRDMQDFSEDVFD